MKKTLFISITLVLLLNINHLFAPLKQQRADMLKNWADQTIGPSHPDTTEPGTHATILPGDSSAGEVTAQLMAAGLKPDHASIYAGVQAQTGTPWQLLAAVHQVETGQRGDTTITSYAGAQGPMQFLPSTFRAYALDGDDNGTRNIHDLDDAMLTAGRYLAANGAAHGDYRNALYHYNHSWSYVNHVLSIARRLGL